MHFNDCSQAVNLLKNNFTQIRNKFITTKEPCKNRLERDKTTKKAKAFVTRYNSSYSKQQLFQFHL